MRSANNMSCWWADDCGCEKDIANAEREIANLKDRISGAQAEVLILTDVKNKTTNMTETIDAKNYSTTKHIKSMVYSRCKI